MTEDEKVEKKTSQPSPANGTDVEALAARILRDNQAQFMKANRSQRFAFATMKWMFLVLFVIAVGALIAAVRIALDVPADGYNWAQAGVAGAIGLSSVALFWLLLYMRPLAALERNSVVQSFLTVVVNSYWTRLLYVNDAADVDDHLDAATAYTVQHLGALLDRQILGASKFMSLVRAAQDEAGQDPGAYSSPV